MKFIVKKDYIVIIKISIEENKKSKSSFFSSLNSKEIPANTDNLKIFNL